MYFYHYDLSGAIVACAHHNSGKFIRPTETIRYLKNDLTGTSLQKNN